MLNLRKPHVFTWGFFIIFVERMKGKKRELLTEEAILSRISEYDIYRFYLGRDFKVNRPMHSPMPGRKDNDPSFLIGNKHGFLYHIDFGDSSFRGRCMDFVKQINMMSDYFEVLLKVDRDFGLGISSETEVKDYKKIISEYKPDKSLPKSYSLIQCKVRRIFHTNELEWWKQFYQNETDLRRENIFPVTEHWLDYERVSVSRTEMVFGYLYDDKWKVYRPQAKTKRQKWLTNVRNDKMEGLENITNCKNAIITKSKKDKMVISKIFPCVCAVQSENVASINDENLEYLRKNSKVQWINFDSDAPGKKASWAYTTEFNFKHINVPDDLFPIKDFADMAKEKGLDSVKEYFKLKGLL